MTLVCWGKFRPSKIIGGGGGGGRTLIRILKKCVYGQVFSSSLTGRSDFLLLVIQDNHFFWLKYL